MTRTFIIAIGAALAVAGCGSSGGGDRDLQDLFDDALGTGVTQVAALPRGTASFEGKSVWRDGQLARDASNIISEDVEIGGLIDATVRTSDATIQANFDNRRVIGRLDNWKDSDGENLDGILRLDGGYDVSDGEADIFTNISGNLESGERDGTVDALRGGAVGTFLGDDGDDVILIGEIEGLSTIGTISGLIIAERD